MSSRVCWLCCCWWCERVHDTVLGLQEEFELARKSWASTLTLRRNEANKRHQRRVIEGNTELQLLKRGVEIGSIEAAAMREALVLGHLTRAQRMRMGEKYELLNRWKHAVSEETRAFNSTANQAAMKLQMAEVGVSRR